MTTTIHENLREMLQIGSNLIRTDLQRFVADPDAFYAADPTAAPRILTAKEQAMRWHDRLIEAAGSARLEHVPPEVSVVLAAQAADVLSGWVSDQARQSGRCLELSAGLRDIEIREGGAPGDHWNHGEAPDEYKHLYSELQDIEDRAVAATLEHILGRYGLGHLAELMESAPDEFAIQREIGMRIMKRDFTANTFNSRWTKSEKRRILTRVRQVLFPPR